MGGMKQARRQPVRRKKSNILDGYGKPAETEVD
jgi:hypothetical protein